LGVGTIASLRALRDLSLAETTVFRPGAGETHRIEKQLTSLSLAGSLVKGPGLGALRELPALRRLDLTSLPLHDDALALLPKVES
jgi:hypothetical protein